MTEPLPPLDPSLQALLASERQSSLRSDMPDVQARVRQAVKGRIDGGNGGDGGGSSTPPDPGPSSGLLGGTVIGLGGAMLGVVLGAAVGLPAGWMLHGFWMPEPVAPLPIPAVVAPLPAPAPPEPAEPTVPATPPAPAPAPVSPLPPEPTPEGDSEQARIDQARVALRRGRPHDALVALMGHAREFPEGRLAEERDRLTIEALVAQGRIDPARVRLEAFRARWPNSIHLAALEALFLP